MIVRHALWRQLPDDAQLLGDLQVTQAELDRARASRLERHVLLPLPAPGAAVLEPALSPLLNAALYFETLAILRVKRSDEPVKTANLSWRPGQAVRSKVETRGVHVLEPLTPS